MKQKEIEEAMKAYRRIAERKMEAHSLQPNSDSRLMKAIKKSSQGYVHKTGQIRLQDIDGIGPNREKKLAKMGIWLPDDLYDEYKKGNYEGLLALQKNDNGFTPEVLARAISSSPQMPPSKLELGTVTLKYPDETPFEVNREEIYDVFRKEMEGKDFNSKEKKIDALISVDQRTELLNDFKTSNTVDGIQRTLEDAKDTLSELGRKPKPFALEDEYGKLIGRRPEEIKEYLDIFGVNGKRNQYITLEERGAFLTDDIMTALDVLPSDDVKVITSGLREVTPAGKRRALKEKILDLTMHYLDKGEKNDIEGLWDRSSIKKLAGDRENLKDVIGEMIEEDKLQPTDDIDNDKFFPTEDIVIKEITRSKPLKIGKTNNPRIPDYFDTIIKYPNEPYSSYWKRLMNKGGKAVMENTGIVRRRLNLKVPISNEDDLNEAVKILGFNIKNGFSPEGYEYKDPRFAERYNTFNVFAHPSKDAVNKHHKGELFTETDDNFVFLISQPTDYVNNHELTNIMTADGSYITSLCPVSKQKTKIKRNEALASALAGAMDTMRPNRRGITEVVDKDDGIMTALCKLGKEIKSNEFKGIDCYAWNQDNFTTKIQNVLESDEFEIYGNKKYTDKFREIANVVNEDFKWIDNNFETILKKLEDKNWNDKKETIKKLKETKKRAKQKVETLNPILEKMKSAESKAENYRQKARNKIGKTSHRRRVECTQVEDINLGSPDNKIIISVPKSSSAGRQFKEKISRICPADEVDDVEKCVRNKIRLHQNLTEGDKLTKNIRYKNMKFLSADLLNDGLKIIRNKVFGSPDDWIGGRKKQKMVFDQLEMGKYSTLDLGEWDFLKD